MLLSRGMKVGIVDHVDAVVHYTPDISVHVPEGMKGDGADTSKGVRINEVELVDKATGEGWLKKVRGEVKVDDGVKSMFGSGSGFRGMPPQRAFNQSGSGAQRTVPIGVSTSGFRNANFKSPARSVQSEKHHRFGKDFMKKLNDRNQPGPKMAQTAAVHDEKKYGMQKFWNMTGSASVARYAQSFLGSAKSMKSGSGVSSFGDPNAGPGGSKNRLAGATGANVRSFGGSGNRNGFPQQYNQRAFQPGARVNHAS